MRIRETRNAVGNMPNRVVIVGAGHAGATAAAILRRRGFDGEVLLLGAEQVAPYHRPPLSKALVGGHLDQALMPDGFFDEHDIDLRLGTVAEGIEPSRATVVLSDGSRVAYDSLILATGASARGLEVPGFDLPGVYRLRTLDDARRLRRSLRRGARMAIVGGGWIGLEVASSAHSAGVEVTVLEREERLLSRVASAQLAAYLTDVHLSRGVDVVTGARVTAFDASVDGSLNCVVLASGARIPANVALVGVGAVANMALAHGGGLLCDHGGVVVDSSARTSDPMIYAIGDVTSRPIEFHGGLFRLESIPSATEQARQAVASILDEPAPEPSVPWFWSDQFDLKVRIAGVRRNTDRVSRRRTPDGRGIAFLHLRGERMLGVETINSGVEFKAGRNAIRSGAVLDVARLDDENLPIDGLVTVDVAKADEVAAVFCATPPAVPLPEVASTSTEVAPAVTDAPSGRRSRSGECAVTFVQPDGAMAHVNVAPGVSLMEAAVRANVEGIIAECGGSCSCGTCHVYVDERWRDLLDPPDELEVEMLDFVGGAHGGSRLSCQIAADESLDGIVVRVAEEQG
jgi:3-phenylpropionate/trans-cinnamate dioxygenase ferredoxin reductase component